MPGQQPDHAVWEREMRHLHVGTRVLAAALLALLLLLITGRPTPLLVVTAVIVAVLLLSSIGLTRRGRRVEPPAPDRAP